jgi:two-component system response regulator PilR (NtrC family)
MVSLEALSEMLESMGFSTTCAMSVEEGLAQLESRHFDILLSDVKLHEASGIDLASLAWRDRLVDRVILMSGYVPDEDTLDSAWQFVRKPLDIESLVNVMRADT